ncbi:MAG TPA: amidohydrolase family protein [Lacunisphaera sp.]
MIVDAHVHLYPPEVNSDPAGWAAAHGERHWAGLCTRRRKDGKPVQAFPSVDQLLRDMDAAGIGKSVLLGWYWEKHESCVAQNRFYADCIRAHPDRLAAFATVHPAAGTAALDELRRAQAAGLIGLGELSPHSQHVSLADPRWRQLIALAGELKLPINLHVSDPSGRPYPGRVATPLADFVGLAREFPSTKFILAHWGGGLAFDSENRVLRNVYYDTAASPLLYGPEVWPKAPTDRVLFGSDYPLILYPRTETAPEFGGLITEAKDSGATNAVFGGNAVKLFGW